jgi:hypothetical protein
LSDLTLNNHGWTCYNTKQISAFDVAAKAQKPNRIGRYLFGYQLDWYPTRYSAKMIYMLGEPI